jgi:hypothetical protein
MKRVLALLTLIFAMQAHAANTWGTDMSDMWWNPNESGWGANIAHQQEVVFLTLYVYGTDSRVRWYVGPDLPSSGGGLTFSGALYETTGPYFGGAFNPTAVTSRVVGSATVTMTSASAGTLTYSVDGVVVTKSIQRQSFRTSDMTGDYTGALVGSVEGCGAPSNFANTADLSIAQVGSTFTLTEVNQIGTRCNYAGTYFQDGRMGGMNGTFNCSNGISGSVQIFEAEASYIGFMARYIANYGSCHETGKIGGMKR